MLAVLRRQAAQPMTRWSPSVMQLSTIIDVAREKTTLPVTLNSSGIVEILGSGNVRVIVDPAALVPLASGTGKVACEENALSVRTDGPLELTLPQRLGHFSLEASDANVSGKLEVDGTLRIKAKTVSVVAIRSQEIEVACDQLEVSKLLEAQRATVTFSKAVLAKLQAQHASFKGGDVTIESAYCSELVCSGNSASIDTFHGRGLMRLEGEATVAHLSGSVDAVANDVDLNFDGIVDSSRIEARRDVKLLLCADDNVQITLRAPNVDLEPNRRESEDAINFVKNEDDGSLHGQIMAATSRRRQSSDRGAGKVDASAAAEQRWDSAVHSSPEENAAALLDAKAGRTLTFLKPTSWIDKIRARVSRTPK